MLRRLTIGVTYTLRDLWNKACEHDRIDPTSRFVVFGEHNPWAKKYNKLALCITQATGFAQRYPNLARVSKAPIEAHA